MMDNLILITKESKETKCETGEHFRAFRGSFPSL